jgi:uncharacterized protein (TIGR03437 family)
LKVRPFDAAERLVIVRPGLPCCGAILAGLIANSTVLAQSAPFAVVSAARYQAGGAVAPDSLAALFGSNLAGSSVEVNGEAARLLYVSSSQINFVVPADIATGTGDVLVRNTATGATQSATIEVQNAAAAVFSVDGSGKGPGAILNAVTYATAPFLVVTPEIAGSDQRTRLAVYATGLRYAGNPSHDPSIVNAAANVGANAKDAAGNNYNLTVEYAGPAPGYFGLDQVNVVLPPDLDGAGVVSLSLTAENNTSNVVSFRMGSLPASSIRVAALSFSLSYVNGGDSAILTITLNGVARSMGFPVSLSSNNPRAQVPYLVTVPVGQASLQVAISTSPVTTVQTATITAQAAGATETAALEIDPANALAVSTLSVTPTSVLGGRNVSATVTLSGTATVEGVKIGISSDNSAAQPPATVTVPFTASSATFSIPTSTVTASQTCNITATLGRSSQTTQFTVIPALQLVLASNSVVGGNGNTVSGTVIIADSAPLGGATVNLQSSNSAATVPNGGVVIPSGQTSAPFTITTAAVTAARTVTITAKYGGLTQTATLTVNPPASPTLTGVTVSPDHVTGGTNATGIVTLGAAAPLGGITVTLQSSLPVTAQVPAFVTVQQGATTASFTIATTHVTSTQTVTITAKVGGVTETAVLTVQ